MASQSIQVASQSQIQNVGGTNPQGQWSAWDPLLWSIQSAGTAVKTAGTIQGGNFGFNIPAGATIDGIETTWRLRASPGTNNQPMYCSFRIDGSAEDRQIDIPLSTSYSYPTLGSPTDKWGDTWTPARINSPDFKTSMSQRTTFTYATWWAGEPRITVYYTEQGTPYQVTQSVDTMLAAPVPSQIIEGTVWYGGYAGTPFGFMPSGSTPDILDISREKSHSIDTILSSTRTVYHSIDVALYARSSQYHSVDVILKKPTTVSSSVDTILYIVNSRTHSFDTVIADYARYLSHSFDMSVKARESLPHSIDTSLSIRESIAHSIDTYLAIRGVAVHSFDTVLLAKVQTTHSIDTLLLKYVSVSHSFDTVIKSGGAVRANIDTVLSKRYATVHSIDTVLRVASYLSHSFDTILLLKTGEKPLMPYISDRPRIGIYTDVSRSSSDNGVGGMGTVKDIPRVSSRSNRPRNGIQ